MLLDRRQHTIDVFHREFQDLTNEWTYDFVATVKVPEGMSEQDGLEYAYRWTQNTDGSWSRKIGQDANTNVAVYVSKMINGRLYGLRSSMVGDMFVVDSDFDKQYKVAMFGFEPVSRNQ